jgi:hypothetical protein
MQTQHADEQHTVISQTQPYPRNSGFHPTDMRRLDVAEPTTQTQIHDGRTDFDFLIGTWKVHNRQLKGWLKGSNEWIEFEGTSVARKILDGLGNIDEIAMERPSGLTYGMTLRLFNPQTQQWSIYWANSQLGTLDVPMIGEFKDGRGEFYDQEFFEGKPIFSRFIWSVFSPTSCRWEQAFSADGGKTWETNWIMDFTRAD